MLLGGCQVFFEPLNLIHHLSPESGRSFQEKIKEQVDDNEGTDHQRQAKTATHSN